MCCTLTLLALLPGGILDENDVVNEQPGPTRVNFLSTIAWYYNGLTL